MSCWSGVYRSRADATATDRTTRLEQQTTAQLRRTVLLLARWAAAAADDADAAAAAADAVQSPRCAV